ncbi:glycosyltransferase [Leptobacterium flavescens]|uniref:Glycosyltransferase n=1 Tax=Leptobacterium flavescens TaxID=472055 RepID=A0A6P0UP88_9FLAO|nr:glycosyltransferase [Leptobacterium flavescens]NER12166.1 glycosyltransferase [Leptobacterium flavescens]
MRLLVITNAPTLKTPKGFAAYAPYVYEMDIWFRHLKEITLLSPSFYPEEVFTIEFEKQELNVVNIPFIHAQNAKNILGLFWQIPLIIFKLIREISKADHIHLRCPGNIGLLASVVQVFFPSKKKTVKYAGNWDPKAKQPLSYKLQKKILSNSFLTRNCKVLVYGTWPDQSKNVFPFFTASYSEADKREVVERDYSSGLKMVFVGTLSEGKRPLYAVTLIRELIRNGVDIELDIYGEGVKRSELEKYIEENNLEESVCLHGNVDKSEIQSVLRQTHFLILPSKSEGWPKAVAEAMFWGCIPIATPVSCVSYMLDEGRRGLLINTDLESDVKRISDALKDKEKLRQMAVEASTWSRQFTLEKFDKEIQKLLAH